MVTQPQLARSQFRAEPTVQLLSISVFRCDLVLAERTAVIARATTLAVELPATRGWAQGMMGVEVQTAPKGSVTTTLSQADAPTDHSSSSLGQPFQTDMVSVSFTDLAPIQSPHHARRHSDPSRPNIASWPPGVVQAELRTGFCPSQVKAKASNATKQGSIVSRSIQKERYQIRRASDLVVHLWGFQWNAQHTRWRPVKQLLVAARAEEDLGCERFRARIA